MCGRYAIAPQDPEAWAGVEQVLGADAARELKALQARHNLVPSTLIPMLYRTALGRVQLFEARWGLVPRWWSEPQPRSRGLSPLKSIKKPVCEDGLGR